MAESEEQRSAWESKKIIMTESEEQRSTWDVDIGLLIRLVKNFPYLYNQNYAEFKNIQLRERTWSKISTTLKIPARDCQRTWKNLRDRYSRERKYSLEQPGYNSQWEFYDAMMFLQPFIKRRRRIKRKLDRRWNNEKVKSDIEYDDNTNQSTIVQKILDGESIGISISPENITFLKGDIEENDETEEITLDLVDNLPVKEVSQQQEGSISIVRHHSSEEAFGAYVASRLIDFSLDDRQMKKVKIFKILEDLDEIL